MAKLTAMAAFGMILGTLIASALAYRTATITIETEEPQILNPSKESQPESQKCQEEVQGKDLSHCRQYVAQSRSVLELQGVENQQQEHLQQCCQQIRQVSEECQVEALKYLVQEEEQQGQLEQEEVAQMLQRVRNIPTYCRLSQQRDFRPIWS